MIQTRVQDGQKYVHHISTYLEHLGSIRIDLGVFYKFLFKYYKLFLM